MERSRSELQIARGRLRPLFLRYAAPGVMAMMFLALQSIADGFIVGRLIGADALAAVNIVSPAYALVTAVALIIGIGTQAQMGIYMGSGDYRQAKAAFLSGMTGLAVFAVVETAFINLFAGDITAFLGADEDLEEFSVGYVYGVMPWLPGIAGFLFFDYMLKTLGHPRLAMIVMVNTILLNIGLSLVFVGKCGMETFGAGLGTGISFTLGGILSGAAVRKQFRKSGELYKARGRLSLRTLGRIFYNGSSEGLTEIAMGISIFLFNITLMEYTGKEGVAAFTLINYIVFIGVSVALGVSNGVIPIISYNYGAQNRRRVARIVRLAVAINFVCGVFFLAVLQVYGGPIIRLFIDSAQTQVIDLAVRGARLMSIAFLFNGFNIFAASFFTAIDKAGLSLAVASLRGLVLLIAGIFTLPRFWGVDGIWLTTPAAEALTAMIALFLMIKWKRYVQVA